MTVLAAGHRPAAGHLWSLEQARSRDSKPALRPPDLDRSARWSRTAADGTKRSDQTVGPELGFWRRRMRRVGDRSDSRSISVDVSTRVEDPLTGPGCGPPPPAWRISRDAPRGYRKTPKVHGADGGGGRRRCRGSRRWNVRRSCSRGGRLRRDLAAARPAVSVSSSAGGRPDGVRERRGRGGFRAFGYERIRA